MSLTLREILTEIVHTVGRPHLIDDIDALPLAGADDVGETEAEKLAKRNPLNSEEEKLLAKLQARQDAANSGDETADKAVETPAETEGKEDS